MTRWIKRKRQCD